MGCETLEVLVPRLVGSVGGHDGSGCARLAQFGSEGRKGSPRGVAIDVFAPLRCVGEAKATVIFALRVAPSGVETREMRVEHIEESADRVGPLPCLIVCENPRVELPIFGV
jgi:hypothetical protein